MTNVAGFPVGKGEIEYGILFTDSQGTEGYERKTNYNQKLFKVGNTLIAGTGNGNTIIRTAMKLEESIKDSHSAHDVGSTINGILAGMNIQKKDQERYAKFGILGMTKSQICFYVVDPSTEQKIYQVRKIFEGSALHETGRAFERDVEKQTMNPLFDLASGMQYLQDIGTVAEKNIGVDNKFQIGIIRKNGKIRTLYNPEVDLISEDEVKKYLETNMDIELPNTEKEINDLYSGFYALMNDYHNSLTILSSRVNSFDLLLNRSFNLTKNDKKARNKLKGEILDLIDKYDIEKKRLGDFLNAWIEGGHKNIKDALIGFNRWREEEIYPE